MLYLGTVGQPQISATVSPFRSQIDGADEGNLLPRLELLTAQGAAVASATNGLGIAVTLTAEVVPGGAYYLRVSGTGEVNPLASPPSGFTSYGSLGAYSIIGRSGPSMVRRATPLVGQSLTLAPNTGIAPVVRYQWFKNRRLIAGASSPAYSIPVVTPGDKGVYEVEITDASQSVTTARTFVLPRLANSRTLTWGRDDFGQTDVPSSLSDVIAIAAGSTHCLAARADGTVAGWGSNAEGESSIPADLSHVVDVKAGWDWSLALKDDGTVVAWGLLSQIGRSYPLLSDVIAIDVGEYGALALKADGTLVEWNLAVQFTLTQGDETYRLTTPPANATDIVGIGRGPNYSLALKADGTVVAWGDNTSGQTAVPPELGEVVAISAGDRYALALKSDGTVVAWGVSMKAAR